LLPTIVNVDERLFKTGELSSKDADSMRRPEAAGAKGSKGSPWICTTHGFEIDRSLNGNCENLIYFNLIRTYGKND